MLKRIIFLEIVAGLVLCLFSLWLFAEIAGNVFGPAMQAWDTGISRAVYSLRTPEMTHIMIFISYLGADFLILGGSLVSIFLATKHRKSEAVLFVFLLAMGLVINVILKSIYQRPRPDLSPLINLSSYSFPSGHAMNAFIFYSTLSFFVYHLTGNKKLTITVSLISIILILLIGFSRVYLGVHYPSDVIAGFIAGFFVFMTAVLLQRTNRFFHLKSKT